MDTIECRERIYGILADSGSSFESSVQSALEVGAECLDLPVGFFTRIRAGTQEIRQSTGDHPLIQPGESCPLDQAYCTRTVEIQSPLAIQDANVSSAVSEEALETFGLGAYIGARVVVGGETYGTVCFADTEPRSSPFSESESFLVELIARLVGQTLERREYETALDEREAEIDEREAIHDAVVDSSFDLVFRVDDAGRFTYISTGVEELLGMSPEAYLGEPFTAMLPDEETVAVAEGIYESVMAGQTVEREDFRLEAADDTQVVVDIRAAPLYSGEVPRAERSPADIIGVQGMARDARDRRRRLRTIRVLNRVLRHNLRNDMTVINGSAEVLAERLDGEEAGLARRILATSEGLLDLTETAQKLEANLDTDPSVSAMDVVPMVVRATDRVRERHPDVEIELETPPSAEAAAAPRLETAVAELVDNAALHAGDDPAVEVIVSQSADEVLIRVIDDGPGLPDAERAVLETGEETPLLHGSGLGLWLVHYVVETLQGKLTIRDGDAHSIEIALGTPPAPD